MTPKGIGVYEIRQAQRDGYGVILCDMNLSNA